MWRREWKEFFGSAMEQVIKVEKHEDSIMSETQTSIEQKKTL